METVLYSFRGLDAGDGDQPTTGLLADNTGALYGTTVTGGVANSGTVFKLTPPQDGVGQWTETVLYSFCGNFGGCVDGKRPVGLTEGKNGEFYGVTEFGGPLHGGAIFRLTPPAAGQSGWTETVLAGLPRTSDPQAGLVLDTAGALYGTTSSGGAAGHGTVFKVTPPGAGKSNWVLTTLWSFGRSPTDGHQPLAALTMDASGSLYGTTSAGGGLADAGTVFRLSQPVPGQKLWRETVLHHFHGTDGAQIAAGVVFDSTGALYGVAAAGGADGLGSVFRLTPPGDGRVVWPEKILHMFHSGTDAAAPTDPLLLRPSGVFLSTSFLGGKSNQGAVYQLTP